jgi:hypothetical protein
MLQSVVGNIDFQLLSTLSCFLLSVIYLVEFMHSSVMILYSVLFGKLNQIRGTNDMNHVSPFYSNKFVCRTPHYNAIVYYFKCIRFAFSEKRNSASRYVHLLEKPKTS